MAEAVPSKADFAPTRERAVFAVPDSRRQLEQWGQRRGVQLEPVRPPVVLLRRCRGPLRFSS